MNKLLITGSIAAMLLCTAIYFAKETPMPDITDGGLFVPKDALTTPRELPSHLRADGTAPHVHTSGGAVPMTNEDWDLPQGRVVPAGYACIPAKRLGVYRVTWYGKGKWKSGKPFKGRYHTAAARICPKNSQLLVRASNGRTVLVYVNDVFGPVKYKDKILPEEQVTRLVEQRVLAGVDLAYAAAVVLGLDRSGHAECEVFLLDASGAFMSEGAE